MENPQPILVGKGETPVYLLPAMANRHGLIAGATGTGKTVSLQVLAEGFSRCGIAVFMADVKGDLAGLSQAGVLKPKLTDRARLVGIVDFAPRAFPTLFWDLFHRQGHPIRATVSGMGPLLLARLLNLNDTQQGVLNIAFKFADAQGLLLLDLKDLRSLLARLGDRPNELRNLYGNINTASVGAIQRALLVLEQQGAEGFFGEPALELEDLLRTNEAGEGFISILAADRLLERPGVYSTFLLWILAKLFEELPEVGDLPRPKLVFFFDEAHLLFRDTPKALIQQIEQVVRLIRSKGVGVYFVTQNPLDIPDSVLGQLGNRIQHALRAFTPRDQKAVRAAAQTLRPNPPLDTESAITELGVGEALLSMLQADGSPGMVQRALIRPPASRIGPISDQERDRVLAESPHGGKYDRVIDRESAYERLQARPASSPEPPGRGEKSGRAAGTRDRQGVGETFAKSLARSLGSTLGGRILRGVLGAIVKNR